ncbi:MAG: hypothetical protein AB1640_13145 [bacterium]
MSLRGSAVGRMAPEGYSLYASTKAALDRFAEGYRREMDPHAHLLLAYPLATRSDFYRRAGGPPIPWPSQTPEQVARAMVKGITRDKESIYASSLLTVMLAANRQQAVVEVDIGCERMYLAETEKDGARLANPFELRSGLTLEETKARRLGYLRIWPRSPQAETRPLTLAEYSSVNPHSRSRRDDEFRVLPNLGSCRSKLSGTRERYLWMNIGRRDMTFREGRPAFVQRFGRAPGVFVSAYHEHRYLEPALPGRPEPGRPLLIGAHSLPFLAAYPAGNVIFIS